MADVVVTDALEELVADLGVIVDGFKGASELQDDHKGRWGQHNANLTMGDFAHNWQHRRKNLVEKLEGLRTQVEAVAVEWARVDEELAGSLGEGER